MSLLKNLEEIRDVFLSEIRMVRDFIEETQKSLTRKQRLTKFFGMSAQDRAELDRLTKYVAALTAAPNKKPPSFTSKSSTIREFLMTLMVPMKHKGFLAEMTLSYLVSYQEAFIKEYLRTVLIARKSILKSKKQLTYGEVCAFRSIKSLISHVAQKEIDALGYGSVDDVADYFENHFNLAFTEFHNWPILREASFRRNLILHNSGVTNDTYCAKTGYKRKNQHLITDADYVRQISKLLLDFIHFFHLQMTQKLQLLPPPPASGTR